MHIEPGFIVPIKVAGANIALLGVLGGYLKSLVKNPVTIVKALIAATFFSIFMQAFHMPVGPSELHFVGAMVIYLTLGFVPTMFGLAIGLALQGVVFDPHDLPHLAVNSLSLIMPLITVHYLAGKKLFDESLSRRLSWKAIIKLDAIYYGGVTLMVGFWLLMSNASTPFASWVAFASSYLVIVACEPVITLATVRLLKRYEHSPAVRALSVVNRLRLAS